MRGLQRASKLKGSLDDRREAIAKEIADVVATAAVLAHALGLNFDDVMATRTTELTERRRRWLDVEASAQPADL